MDLDRCPGRIANEDLLKYKRYSQPQKKKKKRYNPQTPPLAHPTSRKNFERNFRRETKENEKENGVARSSLVLSAKK